VNLAGANQTSNNPHLNGLGLGPPAATPLAENRHLVLAVFAGLHFHRPDLAFPLVAAKILHFPEPLLRIADFAHLGKMLILHCGLTVFRTLHQEHVDRAFSSRAVAGKRCKRQFSVFKTP
jgi:hypothetical protein